MAYIERDLERKIAENLGKPEIIAVVGPRQSGKTTLLRHVFQGLEKADFVSFEDREELELFVEDEKAFAEAHLKGFQFLFIDEFQYAKDGGKKLKYLYDAYPGKKIIISGSSAPGLTMQGIRHLVGRIFVFNLYPLSFEEFLRHKDRALFRTYAEKKQAIRNHVFGKGKMPDVSGPVMKQLWRHCSEYMIYGGYPRVAVSESEEDKRTVLKNIYSTYFLREIKDLLAMTTDFNLAKLIKALSLQLGGLVSYRELGNVSGFDYNGLMKHLNVLEKTFICMRVPPFYKNKRAELVKIPKVYFFDSGLRNAVIGNFRPYGERQDAGQLNENFIFTQLAYSGSEVKFWRSKAGAEVDFVLEKEGRVIAIESKNSFKSMTKSLASFREKHKPFATVIMCRDRIGVSGGVSFMPFAFASSLI